MKSVAFFVGVFCAGLVIFLLFTGQISTLFTGSSWDEETKDWAVDSADKAPNRVSHTAMDPNTGLVRFSLTGILDDESLSMDQIDAPTSLTDAVVKIPIHQSPRNDEQGNEVVGRITAFELAAGRISYHPHSESKRFEMRGGIEGAGDDGSRIRTDSIDVELGADRSAMLVGHNPVEVSFPAFRLFGTNGFEGAIDSQLGLTRVTIAPPVVVALDRTHGGALLGLGQPETDASSTEEQVFLISKGPLVIDRSRNEAVFQGEVVVFPAGPSATLNPAPEPTAARSRFECEGLRLSFDSTTVRFVEAEARRGQLPVRGFLMDSAGDLHELNADHLLWNEASGRVDVDGDVSIQGSRGSFRAQSATVFPREQRAVLREQVAAELRSRMRVNADASDDLGPDASDWLVSADGAEFTYGRAPVKKNEPASSIENLRAWSAQPGKLLIRERRENGARVEGSTLVYDARAGSVQVTGPESSSSTLRPTFRNGRSRVGADRMTVQIDDRALEFSGEVQGEIYGWDVQTGLQDRSTNSTPSWLQERGPDDYADIRCEWLRVRWGADSELRELAASGSENGAGPTNAMSLELRGEDWCRCSGERFEWSRELQRLSLTGPSMGQTLETTFAKLRGEQIEFDLARLELSARDTIELAHLEVARSATGRESELGGSMITIDSPELRLSLAERAVADGNDEQNAKDGVAKKPPGLEVVSASAWNSRGGQVSVVDGALAVAGQQVTWDARLQQVKLNGEGLQKIFRFGPAGIDDLVAERINVDMARGRAVLEGQVRATLHQGGVGDLPKSAASAAAGDGDCPWRVEAGKVVIEFTQHSAADNEGAERRLVLEQFEATKGVRVSQDATQVVLMGTTCHWQRRDQTLRILDPEGQAMQTVQHGDNRGNSIISRQIHVTPELRNGRFESVWLFMQDQVLGTFHPEGPPEDGSSPDTFRLISDNLLVKLAQDSDGVVHSGSAWGNVVFQGGDYQVFSSQALYRGLARELSFYGAPGEQVQLVLKGKNMKGNDRLTLRREQGGGYSIDMKGSEPWGADEIKTIMKQLEKEERVR